MRVRLGTRKTLLARAQTSFIENMLHTADIKTETYFFSTLGDTYEGPIHQLGGKGVFVKELEKALLDEKIDLAVHALKDMPFEETSGLTMAAFPVREDPRDVFVLAEANDEGKDDPVTLQKNAVVGTCSLRRTYQLQHLYPEMCIRPVRGSVETRLKKMDAGAYDALVLAAAGLNRLQLKKRITTVLPIEQCVPAVGQGTLAVQCRTSDHDLRKKLAPFNHPITCLQTSFERAFLRALKGTCHTPVGGHVEILCQEKAVFHAFLADDDGANPAWLKKVFQLNARTENIAAEMLENLRKKQQRLCV